MTLNKDEREEIDNIKLSLLTAFEKIGDLKHKYEKLIINIKKEVIEDFGE